MKLYRIQTTAPEFNDRQNITFYWFVHKRPSPAQRDASKLVEGYEPGGYHDEAIDELFNAAEVELFIDWLTANRPHLGSPKTVEVKLPLLSNTIGVGCLSVGGDDDYLHPFGREACADPAARLWKAMAYFRRDGSRPVSRSRKSLSTGSEDSKMTLHTTRNIMTGETHTFELKRAAA